MVPGGMPGQLCMRVDRLDREAVEQAVFDHRPGAGEAFLARLEDQHGGAVEVARLGQVARGADQHRGVAVVAAAVHQAGRGGLPGEVVVLRSSAARPCRRAGRSCGRWPCCGRGSRRPRRSCRCRCGSRRRRRACSASCDARRGVDLLEAEFGMRVQVAAERGELGMELRDVRRTRGRWPGSAAGRVGSMHQCPPALPTRRRGSTAKYSRSTTRLMTTKISAIRHR